MPTETEQAFANKMVAEENALMNSEYEAWRKATILTRCVSGMRGDEPGWLLQFPYSCLGDFKEAIPNDYRQWRPAIKSWWVSEECGGLLADLFSNWDMPINQRKGTMFTGKRPKCSICKDKGWLPDTTTVGKFSGKPIPGLERLCECRENELESYHRIKPRDYDFPMSFSFYRSLCQQNGWQDPGPDEPLQLEPPPERVVVHRHSNMSKVDYDLLQQTARRMGYLEKKLAELQARRKPKGIY